MLKTGTMLDCWLPYMGKRCIKFLEKYLVVSVEKQFEFQNFSEPHVLK